MLEKATTVSRTRVKICGVTQRADAENAIALGADALGFNTWRGSKRFIDLQKAGAWIREMPPFVTKVAVMVKPSIAEAEAVFTLPFIDAVQFHGGEDEAFCTHFAKRDLPFIKAIALDEAALRDDPKRFGTPFILLDTVSSRGFGGTGELIPLELAEKFVARHRDLSVILSGGLNPANVAGAVQRVHPYAVDVASGVECGPGKKDVKLMSEFVRNAGIRLAA